MTLKKLMEKTLYGLLNEEKSHPNSKLSYYLRIHFPEKLDENSLKQIMDESAEANYMRVSYLPSGSKIFYGLKSGSTMMILSKNKTRIGRVFTNGVFFSRWLMVSYSFPSGEDISEITFEVDKYESYKKEVSDFIASIYKCVFSDNGENVNSFLELRY
jgi:hypothetical protein